MRIAASRRKSARFRLTALFFAVLFLLVGVREGIAGYTCAQHQHAGAEFPGQAHASPPGHLTRQHHSTHGTGHAADHEGGNDSSEEAVPCSCVGDCTIQQLSVSAAGHTAKMRSLPTDEIAGLALVSWILPSQPKFVLPYPNGPPHLG